jgi:hypothetical protein
VSGGIHRGGGDTDSPGGGGELGGTIDTGGNVATNVGAAVVAGAVIVVAAADETGTALTDVVVFVSIGGAAGANSVSVGDEREGRTTRLSTTTARIEPNTAEAMTISERGRCRGSRWSG